MRSSVPVGLDKWMFRRTAYRTKAINLRPSVMRGGIRL